MSRKPAVVGQKKKTRRRVKPLPAEWSESGKVFNRLQYQKHASEANLHSLRESVNVKRRINWVKLLQADNKTEKGLEDMPVY